VRNASFPDGGYFIQRSAWGDRDARFLMFDCGPLGAGGHGHYDLLNVEIAAGGRPLILDPGRYTYSEHEADPHGVARNMRHWFKGTAAHNTVCVDGLDQTSYMRKARPAGEAVARGVFHGRASAPGLDVLDGEAHSPCYQAVHRRRVWFVADAYWVIEDELRGERPHRYDLRFHLAPEAEGRVRVSGPTVRAPGLALVLAPARDVAVEPGWFSPLYGVKEPAPVVSVVADGAPDASFLTLVMPLADSDAATAPRLARRADGAIVVEHADGSRDELRRDGAGVHLHRSGTTR